MPRSWLLCLLLTLVKGVGRHTPLRALEHDDLGQLTTSLEGDIQSYDNDMLYDLGESRGHRGYSVLAQWRSKALMGCD